jgi:L-lactate dehydrogenase
MPSQTVTHPHPHPVRVVIVGVGNVGATFAYALLLSGLASEIVLIDIDHEKAEGEAMDLNHAVPFAHPTHIWAGQYEDCSEVAVTVIAAGSARISSGSRLDLVHSNSEIFRQIVPQVARHSPDGILLIATNPVDVLTYATWKLSGLHSKRVIGSGTILDTARFRFLLGQHFEVDPRSVHAHIIGEHGDSEVPVWSLANIAGMSLSSFCDRHNCTLTREDKERIFEQTRDAAYEIIQRKGATHYAVAAGLIRIVEAVVRDQKTVLSVSSLVQDYCGISDICLSRPSMVDRTGVSRALRLELSPDEEEALKRSAEVLKETAAQLDLPD